MGNVVENIDNEKHKESKEKYSRKNRKRKHEDKYYSCKVFYSII